MRKRYWTALLVGLVLSTATWGTACAEPGTRELLDEYKSAPEAGRDTIKLLVIAEQDGLSWANAALGNDGRAMLYCQPEKLSLTADQMVSMVRRAVEKTPEYGKFPVGAVILVVLRETFPCPKGKEATP